MIHTTTDPIMAPAGKFAHPDNLHKYNPELQAALERLDTVYDGDRHLRRTRKSIDGMKEILRRIGNPERNLRAVHITGSKGKGSVATLVTAGLLEAPFINEPVGTYVGPHILRINERIQINGRQISDFAFADSLNRVMDAVQNDPPIQKVAHYDVLAATGFDALSRAGCKWAVVEVVIGGRLDVTNVLSAPVVVVTNIYLEHTDIMGPSLELIAREKAGIISSEADVICGLREEDPLSSIFVLEASRQTPRANVSFLPGEEGSSIFERNLALARAALESVVHCECGFVAPTEDGTMFLRSDTARKAMTSIPGRQETFVIGKRSTPIVIDGAHVAESVGMVIDEAIASHRNRELVVLLAVGKDKDASSIGIAVRDRSPIRVVATDLCSDSGGGSLMRACDLKEVLVGINIECVDVIGDIGSVKLKVLELAETANVCIVCTGTMQTASKLRPWIVEEQRHDVPFKGEAS